MRTLSVYPSVTSRLTLASWYRAQGGECVQGPVEATGTRTFFVEGLPNGAIVRRAVLEVVVGQYAYGSNKKYCVVNETEVSSAYKNDGFVGKVNYVRVSVTSNRRVDIPFRFMVNVINVRENKTYTYNATFDDMVLKIYYTTEEEDADPDPVIDLTPEKTITVYKPTETDFSHNGLATLMPISCVVTEEAGGAYELDMEHPIDEAGKWELLQEGSIIKAPIPPTYIPETEMPPWSVWLTNKVTILYSKIPTYIAVKSKVQETAEDFAKNPSGASAWSANKNYQPGDLVVTSDTGWMYRAAYGGQNLSPHNYEYRYCWTFVGTVEQIQNAPVTVYGGRGQYKPGTQIGVLQAGELVYKVADFNTVWMKVRSRLGYTGYVKIADCTLQEHEETVKEPARTLYTQLFRVYSISADEASKTVRVSARHISYDLQKNALFDCQLEECDPATAIANLQCAIINDDERTIITDMTEPAIKADWSFQNPLQAILDPEEGLAGQLHAKVIRDNADFFLLDGSNPRRGPTLSYGCNLIGVTWTRSTDDVITRVIPRAKDDKDYIYLDELYIDSAHIKDYPVIYTEVLDSEYSVGQEITRPGGNSYKLDRASVMEKMREEAEDRFYVDCCDAPSMTLDVEFVLLGDTEEYKQYRNLQRVSLYDRITVETGPTGLKLDAQVVSYEWNCIAGRYNRISIGKVYAQARSRLPGYRVQPGVITYKKLSPTLVNKIRGS